MQLWFNDSSSAMKSSLKFLSGSRIGAGVHRDSDTRTSECGYISQFPGEKRLYFDPFILELLF